MVIKDIHIFGIGSPQVMRNVTVVIKVSDCFGMLAWSLGWGFRRSGTLSTCTAIKRIARQVKAKYE